MTEEAPSDGNSVAVWWNEPVATSEAARLQEPAYRPGDMFMIGTTMVNYIFEDNVGLRSTCSFRITGRSTCNVRVLREIETATTYQDTK